MILSALLVVFLLWQGSGFPSKSITETKKFKPEEGLEEASLLPSVTPSPTQAPVEDKILVNTKDLPATFSSEDTSLDGNIGVHKIIYQKNTFSPNTLEILAGDIIWFYNDSSSELVLNLSGTGIKDIQDSSRSILPSQKSEIVFSKKGTFSFSSNSGPAEKGLIYVK